MLLANLANEVIMIVNMHEAKTHLSKYVEKALAGEEVLLARAGEPVVALVPLTLLAREKRNNVILGVMEGAFEVPDDFDEPLADEIVAAFYRDTE
jgi:prevent-host-death family protein